MLDFFLKTLPNLILIGFGLFLAFRTTLWPMFVRAPKGTIVYLCRASDHSCSALAIRVKLDDAEVILAEVSPCTACMEGLKKGDRVTIERYGNRVIACRATGWRNGTC